MSNLLKVQEQGAEELLKQAPPEFVHFAKAMLRMGDEIKDFLTSEFTYQGHCKEEAYLTFYDLRTCAQDFLDLPKEHTYRVDLIDTWEMTRTVLIEKASGKTEIALPGKEGIAVLAIQV
jgi:hypothetical protein